MSAELKSESEVAAAAASSSREQGSAKRAAAWSLAGYAGSQGLRLASNLVLTRLLLKEHFGLMALVMVFVQGLQLFSDVGIGPAIIQSKRGDDPAWLNTAWTIQVMRGVTLWLIACIGATPFAAFYEQDELALLVPVVAFNAAIAGFRSSKTFTAYRDLSIGRTITIELGSQAFSVFVTIVWAYLTHSVWALAGGAMTRVLVQTILGHLLLPGVSNRFHWDGEAARSLFKFGRWVFVSTAFTFISGQADRLIFGRLVSMAELGVYSVALMIASAPSAALGQLNSSIVFPVYSRANRTGGDIRPMYRQARWPMLVMGGWGLAALIACGPSIVRMLYGKAYWDAGWMIQVVSAGIWFGTVLEGTNGAALLSQGLARWTAAGSAGKVVGICLFMPVGYSLGGFPGALWALAASEFCRYMVSTYAARQRGLYGLRQDAGATAMLAASSAIGMAVVWTLGGMGAGPLVETIAAALAVSAVWTPLLVPYLKSGLLRGRSPDAAQT